MSATSEVTTPARPSRDQDNVDVDDVVAPRSAGQGADLVGGPRREGDHFATAQKPAELDLSA